MIYGATRPRTHEPATSGNRSCYVLVSEPEGVLVEKSTKRTYPESRVVRAVFIGITRFAALLLRDFLLCFLGSWDRGR
jgi:hypothetical protein